MQFCRRCFVIDYFVRNKLAGVSIQKVYAPLVDMAIEKYNAAVYFMPFATASPFALIKNLIFARSKYRKGQVCHITGDVHYLLLGLPARETIVTVHDIGFYTNHRGGLRGFIKWILWICVLKRARYVVCITDFTRRELLSCVKIDSRKIVVINNPVAPEYSYSEKAFNEECPRILHIGTGVNKNLARTAMALRGFRCHLRIVGEINDEAKGILEFNGVDYSNVFGISNDEMLAEYLSCDIINFPSTFEGFGMPIIEGQAIGRVVVTSKLEPMMGIAAGGAYLVDPYDAVSIRAGYDAIVDNSELRAALIESGRKNVVRFSVDSVFNEYCRLYREIRRDA